MPVKPKLLFVVTEDWFFCSHRLPMARAAVDAGFEVHVATTFSQDEPSYRQQIEREGFVVHAQPEWIRSLNPVAAISTIGRLAALYRRVRPDIVHHVAIMPALFGSIAAMLARSPHVINSFTGLGYVFVSEDWKAKILRPIVTKAFRHLLNRTNTITILQNEDDRSELVQKLRVRPERTTLIRGSGIDISHFQPLPEPQSGPFTVGFTGRMLEDKGLLSLIEAHRILSGSGLPVRLILAGIPDPKNPSSLTAENLKAWAKEPGIEWWGFTPDVRQVWEQAHVAVLPSRREGLPKSLMEAAACGRALIATDAPGCREVAKHGVNGLLVPVDDADALAHAIATLASDRAMRQRLADNSRKVVTGELCVEKVAERVAELYKSRLAA